jgi:hypothetical protein
VDVRSTVLLDVSLNEPRDGLDRPSRRQRTANAKSADTSTHLGEAGLLLLLVRKARGLATSEDGLAVGALDLVEGSGSVADGGEGAAGSEHLLRKVDTDLVLSEVKARSVTAGDGLAGNERSRRQNSVPSDVEDSGVVVLDVGELLGRRDGLLCLGVLQELDAFGVGLEWDRRSVSFTLPPPLAAPLRRTHFERLNRGWVQRSAAALRTCEVDREAGLLEDVVRVGTLGEVCVGAAVSNGARGSKARNV